MVITISKDELVDLIEQLPHQPRQLVAAVAGRDDDQTFDLGLMPAKELLPTYRLRFETLPEYRRVNMGWEEFFGTLERLDQTRIGLSGVRRAGGGHHILILSEDLSQILTYLIRLDDSERSAS